MFSIGVLGLVYVVGHQIGAHPIAFILYAMVVSAVVLLAVTGLGPDAMRIILAPQSWLVGIGTVAMEVFYYLLLDARRAGARQPARARRHPAVHGDRLGAVLAPAAAAGHDRRAVMCRRHRAVVVHGRCRAPHRRRSRRRSPPRCAFILRSFSAEFHPWNRRAKTVMEKLRITGLVVLVTSHRRPGAGGAGQLGA